jgi:serine/threonine protein phosphatase PrpC
MGGRVLAETGATATVVLLQGGRIITANIGDSAAVLSRRGTPVILSIQHR